MNAVSTWVLPLPFTAGDRRRCRRERLDNKALPKGCGFHIAVIDAPGHGDRPRTAHDEQESAALRKAQAEGDPVGPIVVRHNSRACSVRCLVGDRTTKSLQCLSGTPSRRPSPCHSALSISTSASAGVCSTVEADSVGAGHGL
ncbi:hypothetical protein ACFWIY_22610 [Streptomyces sioyaensis]|uniref:hypothetical protein n=1 Tax=Streptomyces sioyaensis TaxID=67364 RepID=UPI00365BAC02